MALNKNRRKLWTKLSNLCLSKGMCMPIMYVDKFGSLALLIGEEKFINENDNINDLLNAAIETLGGGPTKMADEVDAAIADIGAASIESVDSVVGKALGSCALLFLRLKTKGLFNE